MSYTKQTWATGDTVTATKLNHMEDGIAGAGGFDVVIKLDKEIQDVSITASDCHLIKGSYADVMAKASAGNYVTALIYSFVDGIIYCPMGTDVMISTAEGDEYASFGAKYNEFPIVIGIDSNDDLYIDT